MLEPIAASSIPILVVLAAVLAIGLPVLTLRRTGRPEDLREHVLLSRPGRVEVGCVAGIVVQSMGVVAFALLATAHPFLWGIVALSLGSVVAAALYLHRFRRALRALEAEVHRAEAAGEAQG